MLHDWGAVKVPARDAQRAAQEAAVAERGLKDRERRKIRDVTNDRGRLTKHVLPVLGDNPIADLRPRHMRDLVRTWRANEDMPLARCARLQRAAHGCAATR